MILLPTILILIPTHHCTPCGLNHQQCVGGLVVHGGHLRGGRGIRDLCVCVCVCVWGGGGGGGGGGGVHVLNGMQEKPCAQGIHGV